jgi:hypothetical protein
LLLEGCALGFDEGTALALLDALAEALVLAEADGCGGGGGGAAEGSLMTRGGDGGATQKGETCFMKMRQMYTAATATSAVRNARKMRRTFRPNELRGRDGFPAMGAWDGTGPEAAAAPPGRGACLISSSTVRERTGANGASALATSAAVEYRAFGSL